MNPIVRLSVFSILIALQWNFAMGKLQNVVYWGQNSPTTHEKDQLDAYCDGNSGIQILVLAFLNKIGSDGRTLGGLFGQSCTVGEGQSCEALARSIKKCQEQNIKIVISVGGQNNYITLDNREQAEHIGKRLWDAYGNSHNAAVKRPFGDAIVDGFDFDIEKPDGNEYYQYMIGQLRRNFASDRNKTYYITGSPQCPNDPEPNMGTIIGNSTFDYLWVQWYNNQQNCTLGINGLKPLNYDSWTSFLSKTPSKNATLFIGVPASELGATGRPDGAIYYASPKQLAQIVNEYKTRDNFGGIMMWSAAYSDENVINGCTYAQQASNILINGSPCGAPGTVMVTSTTMATVTVTSTTGMGVSSNFTYLSPPESSTRVSAPGGTVQLWGQCGGRDYSGPTECMPPYHCVWYSEWWSSCH